jgi:hypothetical protein
MTIDVRTGAPVFYECPECKKPTRGLMNGHCMECEALTGRRPVGVDDGGAGSSAAGRLSSVSLGVLGPCETMTLAITDLPPRPPRAA